MSSFLKSIRISLKRGSGSRRDELFITGCDAIVPPSFQVNHYAKVRCKQTLPDAQELILDVNELFMKILSFAVFALSLIFSPGLVYAAEQDIHMKKLETLSQSYKHFVLQKNDLLTHFLYDCALSSDPKKECIERIEEVKDITYKMLGEVESFNTIYKAIVYGSECLDNQLKIDMYSAIFHARNEYSMFQLDLDKICLSKKTEPYLKERCEKELDFKKDFVKTTNSILDNMINHIDINER